MNGIYGMIHLGGNALAAHQNRMALIQQNVANAATPGYRRQRIDLVTLGGSTGLGGLPGVTTTNLRSIGSPLTDRQLVMQQGAFGYHSTRSQVGAVVESFFDPVDGVDLTGASNEFFASLRALSSNPAGMAERRDVVARADAMADAFRRTATSLEETQADVRTQAADVVANTNGTLQRIAELDQQIQVARGANQAYGDLVDQRDRLVQDVSNTLQVRVTQTDDGSLHLSTTDGYALVESGRARTLGTTVDAVGDLRITLDTGVGQPASLRAPGGELGGFASSHNDMIGARLDELDQLAFDFAAAFNAVHATGVGLDGTGGRDLFTTAATPDGAAASLDVNAEILLDASLLATTTDAASLPGGGDLLEQLIAFEDTALAGGSSLQQGLIALTQQIGTDVRDALNATDAASTAIAQLETVQASVSGVSLEEELLALNEAQRAYEASLKVIETGEAMMDSIMNIGR